MLPLYLQLPASFRMFNYRTVDDHKTVDPGSSVKREQDRIGRSEVELIFFNWLRVCKSNMFFQSIWADILSKKQGRMVVTQS